MAARVDASGVALPLARPPRRIVSLVPSITETLCALGLADALVGVTVYCVEPRDVVGGKVRVDNQNGAIEVTAASSGACKDIVLKTSFSHVIVRIPATGGYKVSAHTSFGRISSELPITATGTMGSDALEGTIGNGACALGLSNSNGSIEIAKSL